jgi:hypothetical protein
MKEKLEKNKQDFIASGLQATLGIVPFAGPFLQEVVENIIPNQRLDRLIEFTKILDKKLKESNIKLLNLQLRDENFISLVEDSLAEAAKATTTERKQYIANILKNGITSKHIDFLESKYLLKILSSVNDAEVIILLSKKLNTTEGHQQMRNDHPEIFKYERLLSGDPRNKVDKNSIFESYKEHLANLGLLDRRYLWKSGNAKNVSRDYQTPEINYRVSKFGELFLKSIDLE